MNPVCPKCGKYMGKMEPETTMPSPTIWLCGTCDITARKVQLDWDGGTSGPSYWFSYPSNET
jgi:hypothetical protein